MLCPARNSTHVEYGERGRSTRPSRSISICRLGILRFARTHRGSDLISQLKNACGGSFAEEKVAKVTVSGLEAGQKDALARLESASKRAVSRDWHPQRLWSTCYSLSY